MHSKRYAETMIELATEESANLESWLVDIKNLSTLFSQEGYKLVLENPSFSKKEKRSGLDALPETTNKMVLNLGKLLIDKSETKVTQGIALDFEKLVEQKLGIQHALVTSRFTLGDEEVESIKRFIGGLSKARKVVLEQKVDPKLIGGVVIEVEGRLLDDSVTSKTNSLKRALSNLA